MEDPNVRAIAFDASQCDESFDRHVLGRVFLHACSEAAKCGEPVADHLGLTPDEILEVQRYLKIDRPDDLVSQRGCEPEEEELMVRALLVQNSSLEGSLGPWLAAIVARRALEPNHLWEDLGLAARPDLTKLLLRHFAPLAVKNSRNMRWKKFLYRSLCEAEGFTMCPSPTCDACPEFEICYGDDSGESVLARNNRQARVAA
jgi:nitrogen fixation protein NifQ